MRTTIAAATIAASLVMTGINAQAQVFDRILNRSKPTTAPAQAPAPPAQAPAPAPLDPSVTRANQTAAPDGTVPKGTTFGPVSEIPAPMAPEDVKPTIPLPTGPFEPYMLTKQNGPFMIMAYAFRGPEAPRQALALVLELRNKYHLPAYLLLPKKFPGRSMIRGVPPQAPAFAMKDDVGLPELIRTLDEAAVLVGDEKTTHDAFKLMHQVKKIHPECIDGQPQMMPWRKGQGLSRATQTTNPFVPAEELFPNQPDVLIGRMNDGPHNIRYCPGRYTLQIADFKGRTTQDPKNDPRFKGLMNAMKSPLETAADDAEQLADALSKDKEIQRTGFQPYVYHDRYSSRVTIGSFDSPADPAAAKLHNRLIEIAVDLNNRQVTKTMIVPAGELLDLAPIKPKLSTGPVATNKDGRSHRFDAER